MKSSRVRYLKQREKQETRPMYETAFPEDSQGFVDYYYQWKTKDNEVIVMEGAEQDCSFHVMIHLNPYTLCINGKVRKIPYIVAVATDPHCRRQGKMGQVMGCALQDMERKEMPFAFLLPADPAYYRGQGFVFFPCQDYLRRGGICFAEGSGQEMIKAASLDASFIKGGCLPDKAKWRRAYVEDAVEMAVFTNYILGQRCGIYIRRDAYYYHRLSEELKTEHGGALLLESQGKLHGILLYSISNTESQATAEIKELLLEEDVPKEEAGLICRKALRAAGCTADKVKFTSSRMMVRIASLYALVPLLRSETLVLYEVRVEDSIIGANNGCFRIRIDSEAGSISRVEEADVRQKMDIAELTERLFRVTSVYLNEWV